MTAYFLLPDAHRPSGGVQKAYGFVDALNEVGSAAAVVHIRRGFRAPGSSSQTPVVYANRLELRQGDLLVVPDLYARLLDSLAPRVPKVVLVQGAYLMFAGGSLEDLKEHQWRACAREVIGAIVVSEDSQRLVSHAFPHLPLWRIRLGIDPSVFHYTSDRRPKAIALMPRRGRAEAGMLLHLLDRRGTLRDWHIDLIDNVSQDAVARCLRRSPFFLSFSHREGFGLPPAEAMACGCVVIGYHGGGGREFFDPEYSYPIEEGDLLGFARTVESLVDEWREHPARLAEMGRRASRAIHSRYRPEYEQADVVDAFAQAARRSATFRHPNTRLNRRGILTFEQRLRDRAARLLDRQRES